VRGAFRFLRIRSGAIGLAVVVLVVAIALLGRYIAPHDPNAPVGAPLAGPSSAAHLGTDFLGRDVLSRLLYGGRSVISLAAAATALGYAIGLAIGLIAGYTRSKLDPLLMRTVDVMLAFPPLLFLLILITGAGTGVGVLVVGVAAIQAPGISRIVRTATLEVSVRGYVEAAIARGDRTHVILRREILPNIWGTIVADGGPRFTVSILLVAAVNFLGLGLSPPAADWAMMISENRSGITINIWAVVAPALMIGALTVSINVVADAIAGRLGKSIETEALRR
jgi:ABC-type dipeptide/oligopeptide/nickel transport system permease subunit